MALNLWLIDKSAYARLDRTPDSDLWASRIARGLVQISSLTRLEIGFSFRNFDEASREVSSPPLLTMPIAYLTPAIEDRAVEVQMLLTQSGYHRAPSIPDLLIAATAEKVGMSVLRPGKDLYLIVDAAGQPAEWRRIDDRSDNHVDHHVNRAGTRAPHVRCTIGVCRRCAQTSKSKTTMSE